MIILVIGDFDLKSLQICMEEWIVIKIFNLLFFLFFNMILKYVKWLFFYIYLLFCEGFFVLFVLKVNGCSFCGFNVRDFFLVYFYEFLRG